MFQTIFVLAISYFYFYRDQLRAYSYSFLYTSLKIICIAEIYLKSWVRCIVPAKIQKGEDSVDDIYATFLNDRVTLFTSREPPTQPDNVYLRIAPSRVEETAHPPISVSLQFSDATDKKDKGNEIKESESEEEKETCAIDIEEEDDTRGVRLDLKTSNYNFYLEGNVLNRDLFRFYLTHFHDLQDGSEALIITEDDWNHFTWTVIDHHANIHVFKETDSYTLV